MVNCVKEDAQAFALNGQMIADVNGTWATTGFMEAYGDGYAATKLPAFTVNGDEVQRGLLQDINRWSECIFQEYRLGYAAGRIYYKSEQPGSNRCCYR